MKQFVFWKGDFFILTNNQMSFWTGLLGPKW